MNILFAADLLPDKDSGAAGTEYQTLMALKRRGHEIDELWAPQLPRRIAHGNLHYAFELPWTYRREIRRLTETRGYDVIHVNQQHAYLAGRDHRIAGRKGVFVCRSHGLEDRGDHVLREWRKVLGLRGRSPLRAAPGAILERRLHKHVRWAVESCDGIIVSSSLDKDHLIDKYRIHPHRVALIPQAAPDEYLLRPVRNVDNQRIRRLLYIANFHFAKDPLALAGAANELAASDEPFSLTWICPETDQASARTLLSDRARQFTTFRGWMSQGELMEVFDNHGIFLCTSLFEGFGKVFLEAMARGLVVVGTPTGGMVDVIVPEENGFLVPFHDVRALVATVVKVWENPALARALSKSATNAAASFTWDRVAQEIEEFYLSLLRHSTTFGLQL